MHTLPTTMNPDQATQPSPVPSKSTTWMQETFLIIGRHWKICAAVYLLTIVGVIVTCGIIVAIERPFDLTKRSWGGFEERPTTAKCYRQERTAMLLAFVLGSLGIDQFYAHRWPLAVFKLLTLGAGGIWWFVDVVLWMVGGVYATPGCPGGSEHSWQF